MTVRSDHFAEHVANGLSGRRREEFRIGHVEPDHQPEAVGQIEIEPIGNLDVASQRIEAHRLGVPEPLFEKIRAGRAAFLVEAPILIQGAEHVERLAIEDEARVARLETPESDDPLDGVDNRAAANQFDCRRRRDWEPRATRVQRRRLRAQFEAARARVAIPPRDPRAHRATA